MLLKKGFHSPGRKMLRKLLQIMVLTASHPGLGQRNFGIVVPPTAQHGLRRRTRNRRDRSPSTVTFPRSPLRGQVQDGWRSNGLKCGLPVRASWCWKGCTGYLPTPPILRRSLTFEWSSRSQQSSDGFFYRGRHSTCPAKKCSHGRPAHGNCGGNRDGPKTRDS